MVGQQYICGSVVEPVAFFVNSLGKLPEGRSSLDYKDSDERFNAKLREDVRKVTDFHPQIDSKLQRVTLEEVLGYGMSEHLIEFYKAVKGITAERCYQIIQQEKVALQDLTDQRILEVNEGVHTDYIDLSPFSDNESEKHTSKVYGPLIKKAKAAIEFVKSLRS